MFSDVHSQKFATEYHTTLLNYHYSLLCILVEDEIGSGRPDCQVLHLPPVRCLVVAYGSCIICKFNDGVTCTGWLTVMVEEGIQHRIQGTPLRDTGDQDEHGGCLLSQPDSLGMPGQD